MRQKLTTNSILQKNYLLIIFQKKYNTFDLKNFRMQRIIFGTLFLLTIFAQGQKIQYPVATIADSLKLNANAVVRLADRLINIKSQQKMTILQKKVVTVLNEAGFDKSDYICYYSKSTKVKNMKFVVLDALGNILKTYRKSDFKDSSVGDGYSVFSDNRVLYLDFTPTQYPCTIIFDSEEETSNTAFIPPWYPVSDLNVGIEKSTVKISYAPDLGFDFREENFSPKYQISKTQTANAVIFETNNIIPQKPQDYRPSYFTLLPNVLFRVTKFNLEGVDGQASTWSEFGGWCYKNLMNDTNELPAETIAKVKLLVGGETNSVAIAKKIYQFVQDKTRYVSIQVGIGGFKPMLASDVDRLGYGDCKALSNYTRCLLNAVGVQSYYTLIYGGERQDFNADFASTQGNHAILALPVNDKYVFMECTSQTNPFGYQGEFTDNRMALVVKPEGGELVRTNSYNDSDSSQIITGKYSVSAEGNLQAQIKIIYKGVQYNKYEGLERQSRKIQIDKKTAQFNNINNLKIDNLSLVNDKESIAFIEEMSLSASAYANVTDKIMFAINAFNNNNPVPTRYRKREYPFEIEHGFLDIDDIVISIPENYSVEAMPTNSEITSKFGIYKTEIGAVKNNSFTYKRTLKINTGRFTTKEYNEFRVFMEQLSRNDNAKILLKKN